MQTDFVMTPAVEWLEEQFVLKQSDHRRTMIAYYLEAEGLESLFDPRLFDIKDDNRCDICESGSDCQVNTHDKCSSEAEDAWLLAVDRALQQYAAV
jgi:hypothetical protein